MKLLKCVLAFLFVFQVQSVFASSEAWVFTQSGARCVPFWARAHLTPGLLNTSFWHGVENDDAADDDIVCPIVLAGNIPSVGNSSVPFAFDNIEVYTYLPFDHGAKDFSCFATAYDNGKTYFSSSKSAPENQQGNYTLTLTEAGGGLKWKDLDTNQFVTPSDEANLSVVCRGPKGSEIYGIRGRQCRNGDSCALPSNELANPGLRTRVRVSANECFGADDNYWTQTYNNVDGIGGDSTASDPITINCPIALPVDDTQVHERLFYSAYFRTTEGETAFCRINAGYKDGSEKLIANWRAGFNDRQGFHQIAGVEALDPGERNVLQPTLIGDAVSLVLQCDLYFDTRFVDAEIEISRSAPPLRY